MNLLEKLFGRTSDIRRSAELVEELDKVDSQVGDMLEQYDQLDKVAREAALKFRVAQDARSPTVVAALDELRSACRKRDDLKFLHNQARAKIMRELEAINLPAIRAFRTLALTWFGQVNDARKAETTSQTYDAGNDRWVAVVRNNSRIVTEARVFIQGAMAEVSAMSHRPLDEIKTRVGELERQFAAFDLDVLEEDAMPSELASDLQAAREPARKQDYAELGPAAPGVSASWTLHRVGPGPLD